MSIFQLLNHKDYQKVKPNPITLKFPKDIEREFNSYYFKKYLNHIRISMLLGIIVWALFGILDYLTANGTTLSRLFLIRYAIVLPIMGTCLLLSFTKNFNKIYHSVIFSGVFAAGLAVIYKIQLMPVETTPLWNASLIVVFIYGYAIMRARFVWSTLTGWSLFAIYCLTFYTYKNVPTATMVNNIFFLATANIVGMYICYSMEKFARKDFIFSKIFEMEKRRSDDMNAQLKSEISDRLLTERELESHRDNLAILVSERTRELDHTQREIVYMLGTAAEYKDNYTGSHIKRMSKYCYFLAKEIGLSEEDAKNLQHASQMHDIGKIAIPDSILQKPGKLTRQEWTMMKKHTTIGAEILSTNDSKLMRTAREIALTHHEKWNGSGYPNKLKREDIPLIGRIVCLCDVFDALTSRRPYKEAWPLEDTLAEIDRLSGIFFEPYLVKKFGNILPKVLKVQEPYDFSELLREF